MVDVKELKAQIVRSGLSVETVYSGLGLTKKQWYFRMNNKTLDSNEMLKLIDMLHIENPIPIFFAREVAQEETGYCEWGDKCQEDI